MKLVAGFVREARVKNGTTRKKLAYVSKGHQLYKVVKRRSGAVGQLLRTPGFV